MTYQVFSIVICNQPVRVSYKPNYVRGADHFEFHSPYEPRRRTPISETGYRSHFASSEAVAAWGCPEDYALQLGRMMAGVAAEEEETPVQGSLF